MPIFAVKILTMISKAKVKYIRSLELKKFRDRERAFVAEGHKAVGDLLTAFKALVIVHTPRWKPPFTPNGVEVIEVTDDELRRVSFLQHPQDVLAVFEQRPTLPPSAASANTSALTLALDGVQDPGNMGTIIRIADWFGIESIVCSAETADVYNPKVVQATMGSMARVSVAYVDLVEYIATLPAATPIYGTLLDGDNIYESKLTNNGVIVMGNEGKGISDRIRQLVNRRLLIPNYPIGRDTADSLNVAIATAITCSEFRRRD